MSNTKKKNILHTITSKLGRCCTKPKPSSVFSPQPRRRHYSSSAATWDTTTAATTGSSSSDTEAAADVANGFGGVAVEKDSDDPYLDFRRSMLQMIIEKEIYSRDELKELLNCFLQLNSPYYHGIIVTAFTEIWNGVYADVEW